MTFDPAPSAAAADRRPARRRRPHQGPCPKTSRSRKSPPTRRRGQGDFLYLWIEKRDMGAEYFVRQVARRLDVPIGEVGTAGLKDRHAVTRQMVSVPVRAEGRLAQLDGDGIRSAQRQPPRQQAQARPSARQPLPHPHPRRRTGGRRDRCPHSGPASSTRGCRISTARSASAATAKRCCSEWPCCGMSRRPPSCPDQPAQPVPSQAGACRRRRRRCSTTPWPGAWPMACCGASCPAT